MMARVARLKHTDTLDLTNLCPFNIERRIKFILEE